ncbi:MAG: hypothetical protein IJ478_06070 [Alistipes sp.]|nr:hypothetical protein [Alistipes sp.]
MKQLVLFVCILCMTSCATIFCGPSARVTIGNDSEKGWVRLSVDGQYYNDVTLPATIRVYRGYGPTTVSGVTEDGRSGSVVIHKKFNPVTLTNIAFGGIIGAGVDLATGAVTKPDKDYYQLPLTKGQYVLAPEHQIAQPTGVVVIEEAQAPLEQTHNPSDSIQWRITSKPEAVVYWRVDSKCEEVESTNWMQLGSTPYINEHPLYTPNLNYSNADKVKIRFRASSEAVESYKTVKARQVIEEKKIVIDF